MPKNIKDLEAELKEGLEAIKKQVEEKTAGVTSEELQNELKSFSDKFIEELKAKEADSEVIKAMQAHIDKLDVKINKSKGVNTEAKSFIDFLGDALDENTKGLDDLRNKKSEKLTIESKAAGDGNIDPANFSNGSYGAVTTEVRGLRESKFSPMWLRSLMPNNTTTSAVIQYLKEDGVKGGAGVWDGTGMISALKDKPEVSPKFDLATETVIWIAGLARVKREMLDDVAWLRGYLSRKLITGKQGLFVAENTQILTKLKAESVAYDGDKATLVEAIYDAAFGQLADNYFYPTAILVNNRDLVNLIALNKAKGSGEYDLPPNTIVNTPTGLSISGVQLVGNPQIEKGKFLVMDGNETEFVSRMSPEIRFFEEDKDNVAKNLVTVRVEERILPIVYDKEAVIYGEVAAASEDGL